MAFQRTLKNMMLFNEGQAYVGEVSSLTIPKLARKFEEVRPGGFDRGVKVDMGGEPLECEFACASPMRDVLRQFGVTTLAGVMLRFVGAFQNDETGAVDTIEVIVRGRHEEIDFGEWKPGEAGEFKVKSSVVFYRLAWNGEEQAYVDTINMVERIGGVDRLADIRAGIGL